ncbi:MAG: FtsW/RodA/SpoVE family cell cycle protein, partial [Anaerolineales bacterium]
RLALHATDPFRRLLAAGLTAYLGAQSILIMGGNLRLLPLTGVTLPFISYGGSSLMTAWLSLLILLLISNTEEQEAAPLNNPSAYTWLGSMLTLGLGATLVAASWWGLWRAPDLLLRTDNARRAIADRYVMRGSLLDRNGQPIVTTLGEPGAYRRAYLYPNLSPITGYAHPVYGLGGLEAGLDDTLRGLRGNPLGSMIWEDLLYGTPPPGLDVRLSLDLPLQRLADDLLGANRGAIVLLNASTGEILVMASHPAYDANQMDTLGPALNTDPSAPLLNRATQGQYGFSVLWEIYLSISTGRDTVTTDEVTTFYKLMGIFTAPQIPMPVARPQQVDASAAVRVSPLQMAIAAATLSNNGLRPTAQIAMAINTPQVGWVILPTQPAADTQLDREALAEGLGRYTQEGTPFWGVTSTEITTPNTQSGSWNFIGGTMPDWTGTPIAVAVVIENAQGDIANPVLRAQEIGVRLMQAAISP